MNSAIPLPEFVRLPSAKAHPYPFKIALQAQRLIQGSVFYASFVDLAVGQYARIVPNAYTGIKSAFIEEGMSESTWEISWECFEEYLHLFPSPVFQYALYSLVIHWDWFISKLGRFVFFARSNDKTPELAIKEENKLNRLGFERTRAQLLVLGNATGLTFNISTQSLELAEEMLLVRNLGMHNEWDVDQFYLDRTKTTNFKLGDQRTFTPTELYDWQSALIDMISKLSTAIAKRYVALPDYG
jgi:hypothetical protein